MKTLCLAVLTVFAFSWGSVASGQPPQSIQVNVVGNLETGIIAIGGETTGVVIRSKNITWELELPQNLQATAEGLNGQLVRVKGELEKRQGVETGDRWIVTVVSIGAAAAEEGVGGDGKEAMEDQAAFKTITLIRKGGIAGIFECQRLDATGIISGKPVSKPLSAEQIAAVHQHVSNTDWTRVPASTRSENVSDDFHYIFIINTGDNNHRFEVDGTVLGEVEALSVLRQLIY